jgi:hypothetical protein
MTARVQSSVLKNWPWGLLAFVVGCPFTILMPPGALLGVIGLGGFGVAFLTQQKYKDVGYRCVAMMIGLALPVLTYVSLAVLEHNGVISN